MPRSSCPQCLRPTTHCYCHTLKLVTNHWPVWILQHPLEVNHALGTARIASLSLQQSQLWVGETIESCEVASQHLATAQPLLVYPGEESSDLNAINRDQPVPLLFLDGNWRKTRRMLFESSTLAALPKISFQPTLASRYRLRKAPKPEYLSTLESIAEVLSVLEGDNEKYQPLLNSMDWMIDRQIELMGTQIFNRNYSDA